MLLNKDDFILHDRCKQKLLKDLPGLLKFYVGPYYAGEKFSMGDVLMAPYFDRLCVLKHYRGFEIPYDKKY